MRSNPAERPTKILWTVLAKGPAGAEAKPTVFILKNRLQASIWILNGKNNSIIPFIVGAIFLARPAIPAKL